MPYVLGAYSVRVSEDRTAFSWAFLWHSYVIYSAKYNVVTPTNIQYVICLKTLQNAKIMVQML